MHILLKNLIYAVTAVTRAQKGMEKGDALPFLPLGFLSMKRIKRYHHDGVSLYKHSCLWKIMSISSIGHE